MITRVSKDPNDKGYDPHHAKRRVFYRERLVEGEWVTADMFRRVVIFADGRVIHGDVLVEGLPEDKPEPIAAPATALEVPVDAGFAGAGLVHVPDAPAPTPAPMPAPVAVVESVTAEPVIEDVNRPGVPEEVVVETPSERLPEQLSLDDATPLVGGSCDVDGPCDSCQ